MRSQVIHGSEDIIALPKYGRRLASRLSAPYIQLPGGHFVMREQARGRGSALPTTVGFGAIQRAIERVQALNTSLPTHPRPSQAAAVNSLARALIMGESFLNVERYPFMPFRHWVSAVARHQAVSARQLNVASLESEPEGAKGGGGVPSGSSPLPPPQHLELAARDSQPGPESNGSAQPLVLERA